MGAKTQIKGILNIIWSKEHNIKRGRMILAYSTNRKKKRGNLPIIFTIYVLDKFDSTNKGKNK